MRGMRFRPNHLQGQGCREAAPSARGRACDHANGTRPRGSNDEPVQHSCGEADTTMLLSGCTLHAVGVLVSAVKERPHTWHTCGIAWHEAAARGVVPPSGAARARARTHTPRRGTPLPVFGSPQVRHCPPQNGQRPVA